MRLRSPLLGLTAALVAGLSLVACHGGGSTSVGPVPNRAAGSLAQQFAVPDIIASNITTAGGKVWFGAGPDVASLAPDGTLTRYPLVPPLGKPASAPTTTVVVGAAPDGSVWVADPGAPYLDHVPASGSVTFTAIGVTLQQGAIVPGSDGSVWFSDADRLGSISGSGAVSTVSLPTGEFALAMTPGPGGTVWTTAGASHPDLTVCKVTTAGVATTYKIPIPAVPAANLHGSGNGPTLNAVSGLTQGPNGDIWFTGRVSKPNGLASFVGSITPDGKVTTYVMPGDDTISTSLASGNDGNLWVLATMQGLSYVVRMTPDGHFTPYSIGGSNATLGSIVNGPGGYLWITESLTPGGPGAPPGTDNTTYYVDQVAP